MRFLSELKRRKVFRVAAVYAATAFVVLQAAELVLPRLGVPDWAMSFLVAVVLAGFPIALVLTWALELAPEGGLRRSGAVFDPPPVDGAIGVDALTDGAPGDRTPGGSRSDRGRAASDDPPLLGRRTLVLTGLLVAVGIGLSAGWLLRPVTDSARPAPAREAPASSTDPAAESATPADGSAASRPSVAVLPFDNLSSDPEQDYFADGLTEEILNALAALPKLLVTARTSSFYYRDRDVPVDEIAERLGVDHVLEGSVRRAGERLRVTAQLVRAADGFHVWSDSYDRPVDDAFVVQTDIATQVASALGILLDERQRARMEGAGVRDPEAYALYARGFELYQLAHGGAPQIPTLVEANGFFDRAFILAPGLWAARFHSADLYSHILLELAAGADPASLPEAERDRTRAELERRLRDAMRAAPNAAARDFVELTRRIFSEDWTGLAELTRRAFAHTEACGFDQWLHIAGPAFGLAGPARDFFLRAARCNALDESYWLHAAIASLYLGEPGRALEIAERGLAVADVVGVGLDGVRLESLIALERFDEARASLSRLEGYAFGRERGETWIAAARGDAAALEELRRRRAGSAGLSNALQSLELAARAGDREAANALAALVDARPAGPVHLMLSVYFCLCGAPFDLEVTPNLAARLEEAGLAWPPVAPLRWPLKDG